MVGIMADSDEVGRSLEGIGFYPPQQVQVTQGQEDDRSGQGSQTGRKNAAYAFSLLHHHKSLNESGLSADRTRGGCDD